MICILNKLWSGIMKFKKYLVILLSLLYFDLIFNLFAYDSYLRESCINIVLFSLINSAVIFILTSIWNDKINKIKFGFS